MPFIMYDMYDTSTGIVIPRTISVLLSYCHTVLRTRRCAIYNVRRTFYVLKCLMNNARFTMYNCLKVYVDTYNVHSTYSEWVYCTTYTLRILYVYIVRRTLYVYCICTMYDIQCTAYTIHIDTEAYEVVQCTRLHLKPLYIYT